MYPQERGDMKRCERLEALAVYALCAVVAGSVVAFLVCNLL